MNQKPQQTVEEDLPVKRRGRPRKSDATMKGSVRHDAEAEQDLQTKRARRSKRDRGLIDNHPYQVSGANMQGRQQEEVALSDAPANKKQRFSREQVTQDKITSQKHANTGPSRTQQTLERQTVERPLVSRRGRPRRSDEKAMESTVESTPISRRENTSGAVVEESLTNGQRTLEVRRRGRPPLSGMAEKARSSLSQKEASQTNDLDNAPPVIGVSAEASAVKSQGRGRGGPRASDAPVNKKQLDREVSAEAHPSQRLRQSAVELGGQSSILSQSVGKYGYIEPRNRQVPRSTISAKWLPLDEPSITTCLNMVSDASRPVLLRLRDREKRYEDGHKVLQILANRLRSKLRKGMPFPPPTFKPAGGRAEGLSHADELDFESIIDSIEALERTLNPVLDSIKLLEKEKSKEETALKEDYRQLTALEANARSEARVWTERGRKAHPFVPEKGQPQFERSNRVRLARPRPEAPPMGVFHVSTSTTLIMPTSTDKRL